MVMPERWTKLRYHPVQNRLWKSEARFFVVPAGRRSGKTEIWKRKGILRALRETRFSHGRVVFAAPTYGQAKDIYWEDLKALVPKWALRGKIRESGLVIPLINGLNIEVKGLDAPQRVEGSPLVGIVLDEYGNMKPELWGENIRPALSDTQGWAALIGVPEGRNHYYDACIRAKGDPEWEYYHWTSEEILPASEIAAAKRDLDELTYRQEYLADFVTFEGRAYYDFSDANLRPLSYDASKPLIFTFDFNVAPGTAAVLQEHEDIGTCCIGEVWKRDDSTSKLVARQLVKDWECHHGKEVYLYGDATGGARNAAAIYGTNWDIVKTILSQKFIVRERVPPSNPAERIRLNSVNSRICSVDDTRRFWVDPHKAPKTVQDFEGVRLKSDGSGEIDKKKDPQLSHLSDGIGYYIAYEYPLFGGFTATVEV